MPLQKRKILGCFAAATAILLACPRAVSAAPAVQVGAFQDEEWARWPARIVRPAGGPIPEGAGSRPGSEGTVKLAAKDDDSLPTSRDALFGDDTDGEKKAAGDKAAEVPSQSPGWKGFAQGVFARTYASPAHWSVFRGRLDLGRSGQLSENVKWKIGGRFDYDAAYDLWDFYPSEVRRDQRTNFSLRENYLDVDAGAWEFRLGRQHVVWGEMVGLFFADVVSARDLREFILQDFDVLRIPQWAARAEYFQGDFHAELLWIPVPSYDLIGKPGAEFYPLAVPPLAGVPVLIQNEERPTRNLSNTNYGLRLSTLAEGWDLSGFYYRSMDISPTFFREVVTTPVTAFVFRPRHEPIQQLGSTVSKDLGSFVLKGEGVYTKGRQFNVSRLSDADGVVLQNTLDYALGLDFSLPSDGRLNLQFFQRVFFNYDPDIFSDKRESGASLLLAGKLGQGLEAQALLIRSLNRSEWMFRPKLIWGFERNWRLVFGVDAFAGPATGFFGRYDNKDRVYTELRYDF